MKAYWKGFKETIPDNEQFYFSNLIGYLEAHDEFCSMQIDKLKDSYLFRIAPSHPKYIEHLINALITFHNKIGIKLDFSKSMKTSGTISFKIKMYE